MDSARYALAFLVIVAFPSVLVVWVVAHRFVGVWRRLGLGVTYSALACAMLVPAPVMYAVSGPLLAVEFGINLWLVRWPSSATQQRW